MGEGKGLNFEAKVQSIDDNLPYRYPSRTVKITTPSGFFETPLRAATHYEYRSRMRITPKATIDSPIAVNIKKMNCSQLNGFLTSNEPFELLLRRIEMFSHITQYAHLRLAVIQPTTTSDPEDTMPPAMSVIQDNATLRDRFLTFLVRLQQEAGLNPIAIPFLELPFSTMKPIIVDLHKSITSMDLEPIFFVDLRYQDFKSLIELLTNDIGSQIIGLIYRKWSQAPINYDFLSRTYYDKDVAFLCAQADRYDMRFDDLSTSHFLPFFGADMYAVQVPPGFHKNENIESHEATGSQLIAQSTAQPAMTIPRLEKIRFFDRRSLKVKPVNSASFDPESIVTDMKDEDRRHMAVALENRQEANTDEEKYLALNCLSRFHELCSSTREFQDVRKHIDEGSTRTYVQEKTSLKPALDDIKK